MENERTANLLGALALALADGMGQATAQVAGHGATAPAALVGIFTDPGLTIDQLRLVLQLSHSGTVRLVDRLVLDGLVERRGGSDGRTVALHLTDQGEATTQALLKRRQQLLAHVLQRLAPAEQTTLTHMLEMMLGALVESRQQADHVCRLCNESVCPADQCPVEIAGVGAQAK